MSRGMDPSEVARMVVAGIREEAFVIFTHDTYPLQLRDRVAELAAGRLPVVPDFA